MPDRIQPGIYHRSDEKPPLAYRLVVLNADRRATPDAVAEGITSLWNAVNALPRGEVSELKGQPDKHHQATMTQFSDLRVMIGYGRRLFDLDVRDIPLTSRERPAYLSYLNERMAFPQFDWSNDRSGGEGDFALQLTASSVAAVNCAAVEVWKMIDDNEVPFKILITFDGFARPDGRGWLEFHDGVSNMASRFRGDAITADRPDWMEGGTYMAFLRVRVDLSAWRALGRRRQEIAVGRDKLTGAALVAVAEDEAGNLTPVSRRFDPNDPSETAEWRDPSQRHDRHLERSHIHRSNQSRSTPAAPGSFRMFRQGYEFLSGLDATGPQLGLNFVSFQRDLRTFHHVMSAPGWLGDTSFGGEAPDQMLVLEAGGFYAVPPIDEPFPGHILFERLS